MWKQRHQVQATGNPPPSHTICTLRLGSASQWASQTCSGATEKASQGSCHTCFPSPCFPRPSACGHKSTELGGPFKIFLCHLACQNHSFLCGPFSIEGEKILLAKEIMQCLHKTLKDASIPDNHHVIVMIPNAKTAKGGKWKSREREEEEPYTCSREPGSGKISEKEGRRSVGKALLQNHRPTGEPLTACWQHHKILKRSI